MRLFFLRHGVAENREDWHGEDADRPLTAAGREQMEQIAAGLAILNLGIDGIMTSPYARANESARIAAEGVRAPVSTSDELRPGATLAGLLRLLQAHGHASRLLLVGHEPDFSQMIGELIATPRSARLILKKGGCARVDIARRTITRAVAARELLGEGELVWLLTPRQLVMIGASGSAYGSGKTERADRD